MSLPLMLPIYFSPFSDGTPNIITLNSGLSLIFVELKVTDLTRRLLVTQTQIADAGPINPIIQRKQ